LSINWQPGAPALLVLPPGVESLDEADAAIELWEHYSRKTLDPSQRLVVQVMMAQTAAGRWAAATTGREMARQNGKGDEVEVVELWGLVQRAEAILHTVHDAVLLASQAQQRMLGVLEGHADLRRKVKRKWLGTGQQMIEMRNGGQVWYRTRTGGGGRGVDDIDRLVVDEAQHATEEHLAAVAPTLLANPNPQLNAMGTAGLAGRSAWWWSVRKRALSDDPGAFGYVGHTAEQVSLVDGQVVQAPVDVLDRSLWPGPNPGVAAGRGQGLEFLEEQLRRLGPEAFGREHLCIWDPPDDAVAESSIPAVSWQACEHPDSVLSGQQVFGIAVAEDRTWSCIAVAGSGSFPGCHGEIVDYQPATRWVIARAVELHSKWGGRFGIVRGSPATSLVTDLIKAGIPVVEISSEDNAKHCGQLFDAVLEGRFVHRGEGALTKSVQAAYQRPYGDAWVWSQRKSKIDISPLVAVTSAAGLHGLGVEEMAEPDVVLL
jgi:hypothetical protein